MEEPVNHLREMFPTRPVSDLEEALSFSATIESAVDDLLISDIGEANNINVEPGELLLFCCVAITK